MSSYFYPKYQTSVHCECRAVWLAAQPSAAPALGAVARFMLKSVMGPETVVTRNTPEQVGRDGRQLALMFSVVTIFWRQVPRYKRE